jgi:L-histidine N-alpha-methyltransferase
MSVASGRLRVDVLLDAADRRKALCDDVEMGLRASPKSLPPKWFYDERGSHLFEEITRLPEYYLTDAEAMILRRRAPEIAALSKAETLVELGSGSSRKTRMLLDALQRERSLTLFAPFDTSEEALRAAAAMVIDEYPGLHVHGIVGDFERHLGDLPRRGRRLVAFLGSTIGNLLPPQRRLFLATLAQELRAGEALLIGTDLVKDVERLEAAYNDAAGVTATFNRNVLHVLNRELHADFEPDAFDHLAVFDEEREWIEMRLVSHRRQTVRVRDLDLTVEFAEREELRTETSAKFRRSRVESELEEAGLVVSRWWTDDQGDFALALAFKPAR